jgi:CheY-like chemotaxis protein
VTQKAKGRILVVEDEAMISLLIEDMLEELGYDIVGPASRLDHALNHALQADIDVGLLDINVKGQVVFPVADVLEFRGIPFIFATGYGDSALPERFRGRPTLSKPFALEALGKALNAIGIADRAEIV